MAQCSNQFKSTIKRCLSVDRIRREEFFGKNHLGEISACEKAVQDGFYRVFRGARKRHLWVNYKQPHTFCCKLFNLLQRSKFMLKKAQQAQSSHKRNRFGQIQ